jgi:hypothetical protein
MSITIPSISPPSTVATILRCGCRAAAPLAPGLDLDAFDALRETRERAGRLPDPLTASGKASDPRQNDQGAISLEGRESRDAHVLTGERGVSMPAASTAMQWPSA